MPTPKKAGILRTLWIMLKSGALIAYISALSAGRSMFGIINRPWVDRYIQILGKGLLNAAKISYVVHNPHNVTVEPHERYIFMCNHTSLYDIPLSFVALPGSVRMLAKKELFRIPFFGPGMRAADFPSIDRHNRKQAMIDLARVKELLESGIVVWIAPEGTRSRTGELGKFKKGGFITAIQAKAKIVPVVIKGADKILPAKSWHFHLNETAEIFIGEPIDASAYTLENKEELMEKVETQMRNILKENV